MTRAKATYRQSRSLELARLSLLIEHNRASFPKADSADASADSLQRDGVIQPNEPKLGLWQHYAAEMHQGATQYSHAVLRRLAPFIVLWIW